MGGWAARPLDKLSLQLFTQHGAEANPTACQELRGDTHLCVVTLPQPEQITEAGLPWLRNYCISPDDVIVTGFEVPERAESVR